MFYKNAIAAILVYDITRKESFEELKKYWAEQIKETSSKNIIICIAANKYDLLEFEETTDDTGVSDIDSLTLSLSAISNNYILQQRENRRIISLINKIIFSFY